MSVEKPFTHIDLSNLEEEWAMQHELVYKYHTLLTESQSGLADAEDDLELTGAKLDQIIRGDPEKYGMSKVTDPGIKNAVLRHPKYIKAKEEVREWKNKVNKCKVATISLDHKKKGLEEEVTLWIGKYFDRPKGNNGFREKVEEERKQIVRKRTRDE